MDNTMINTTDVTTVDNTATAVNDHKFAKGVGVGAAAVTLAIAVVKGVNKIKELMELKKQFAEMTEDDFVDNTVEVEIVPEAKK